MSAHQDGSLQAVAMPEAPGFTSWVDRSNSMMITELIACVMVVAVAVALAVDEYRDRLTAARLVEPLLNTGNYRYLWVEEYAVTGSPPVDSVAYDRGARAGMSEGSPTRPESLGSVSGLEALRAKAAQANEAVEQPAGKVGQLVANATVGISDGAPMAAVHRSGFTQPLLLELRPALLQPDAPVVVWLCDAGPPPPGWSAPPARQPRVPDHLLPSACRKGWKP